MKIFKEGKLWDTEKAKVIHKYSHAKIGQGGRHWTFYKTPNDNFFITIQDGDEEDCTLNSLSRDAAIALLVEMSGLEVAQKYFKIEEA
jgi:hypothetical protein